MKKLLIHLHTLYYKDIRYGGALNIYNTYNTYITRPKRKVLEHFIELFRSWSCLHDLLFIIKRTVHYSDGGGRYLSASVVLPRVVDFRCENQSNVFFFETVISNIFLNGNHYL